MIFKKKLNIYISQMFKIIQKLYENRITQNYIDFSYMKLYELLEFLVQIILVLQYFH